MSRNVIKQPTEVPAVFQSNPHTHTNQSTGSSSNPKSLKNARKAVGGKMAISSTRLPFFDEKNYLACHYQFYYYSIYTATRYFLLTQTNFKKLVS